MSYKNLCSLYKTLLQVSSMSYQSYQIEKYKIIYFEKKDFI